MQYHTIIIAAIGFLFFLFTFSLIVGSRGSRKPTKPTKEDGPYRPSDIE